MNSNKEDSKDNWYKLGRYVEGEPLVKKRKEVNRL